MKRFALSLITSILAFTAGLVTASSWTSNSKTVEPVTVNVAEPCAPAQPEPVKATVQSFTTTPPRDFDFGQNGLSLVPERVHLKSESQGYEIDVSYPQVVNTPYTQETQMRKVNQQLKDAATKLYQWPLKQPAGLDPSYPKSGILNTVSFTYQVGLATDSFLSVYFIGYSYNARESNQLQDSFAMNYDLTSGKQLKLAELFKPGSNYLEVISRYIINDVSRSLQTGIKLHALEPVAENFKTWQITTNGVTFNFPTCRIAPCTEGDFTVEIPFEELEPMLSPGIPGKFKITYP